MVFSITHAHYQSNIKIFSLKIGLCPPAELDPFDYFLSSFGHGNQNMRCLRFVHVNVRNRGWGANINEIPAGLVSVNFCSPSCHKKWVDR